ncbi:hypothetical protein IIB79_11055, partial [candidate division KSB1 bacterium]|nr:hypothetical protein [candidate division KSB1 bacterium]
MCKFDGFNTGQVRVGEAYWFNAKEQISITIGKGQTVSEIPFNMNLLEGWNLIGNPYNVSISWNSVITTNGEDTNIAPIYMYVPGTRNFQQGDVIQPFSGGFVWAEAGTTVSISPTGNNSGQRMKNRAIQNKNIILEVEDLTGKIKILVNQNKQELYKEAEDIALDTVIGVKGSGNQDIIFANKLFSPENFLFERKKSPVEESVLFISDIHVGSRLFMEKNFLKCIDYLNAKIPNT